MEFNWDKYDIDISKLRGGKMLCPKCSHERKHKQDKPLSVDIATGLFNCHNCGWKGCSAIQESEKRVYVAPLPRLQKVSPNASKWFEGRGISNNTLLRFKITESSEWMPQEDKQMNCICFNYYQDENLVNIKFRDGKKNFKLSKDAKLIFYNIDSIKETEDCIITEGEIDTLSMYEAGFYNAVSVPNGASKGSQKLEYLDNCVDYFQNKEKVYILTDNDSAGLALRGELARRIGIEKCWFVKYPEGCKDANEVLIKYGKEGVVKLVDTATQPPIVGVETVEDINESIDDLYLNGFPTGHSAEYGEFDQYLTFMLGDMTIITGSPGSGKSTWLSNVLIRLSINSQWRVAMYSPEKQPTALLFSELAEIYTGKAFFGKYSLNSMTPSDLEKSKEFIKDRFFFLKMDESDTSIAGILTKTIELIKRKGINCLVIDPWNYVEHSKERGQSETEYVSETLTKIALFKVKYKIHVFIVAHPTKPTTTKDGETKKPTLYNISGSAHFFNKTDNGIVVSRAETTEVEVQKVRWKFLGKLGSANFYFDKPTGRFTDIANTPFYEKYTDFTETKIEAIKPNDEFEAERIIPITEPKINPKEISNEECPF